MANTPLWETKFLLTLTSPHMHDGRGALKGSKLIRDTQWLLDGNNKNARDKNKPFGDFYKGTYDGDYGPYTGSAVRQAKWFLGYPDKEVNTVIGPVLQSYLRGKTKIPLSYVVRRNLRLKKAKDAATVREAAYKRALTQLGVKENPAGSNRVLYSYWYGIIGSWCAMFVTWNFVYSLSKRFKRGSYYAYVPYIVDDARAGRNGLHLTSNPVRGDVVCFDWNRDGTADHTGIFEAWTDRVNGRFTSIEGNTSGRDWSNGGEVLRQSRFTYQVQAFVHVLEP